MQRFPGKLLSSLAVLALFSACASEPTEELEAAETALAAAKQAEADVYVADGFGDASSKLESARREIAGGNYEAARTLLTEAKAGFEAAAAGVDAAKAALLEQATAAQTVATEVLAEAEEALGRAPRGKGSLADLQALQSDLDEARAAFAAAEADLTEGAAADALSGFQEASSKARAVIAAVPS